MTLVIDLSNLTASQGFVVQGDSGGDAAGYSVASAGDINGDGIDDLIIGARAGDDGGSVAGEAYIVYGRVGATRANIDLSELSADDGFAIQGDADTDHLGFSVSSAGDVNGDGIDDVIVGAWGHDLGGYNAGAAYVIYGKAGAARDRIDLSNLSPNDGFKIQGATEEQAFGYRVASAGDFNGDGIDDLIVGAPLGYKGEGDAGEAYVIYGRSGATRELIDLSTFSADDGFIVEGRAFDLTGWSVSSAGDVNGDSIADLIIGAPFRYDGGLNTGTAFVVYGRAGGLDRLNLTDLAISDGFAIEGATPDDRTGFSVSIAGDVNGDGLGDLVLGAPGRQDGGTFSGGAYVIYGQAGATRESLDLATLSADDGFFIQGDAAGDFTGWSVASAGDINGDGFDDLIIGAPFGDDASPDAGEAYVIYGQAGTARTGIDLDNLSVSDGFIIKGEATNGYTGQSVSGAGDVNGDGLDDLVVGAPNGNFGGGFAGQAYVIYGSRTANDIIGSGSADSLAGTTLADDVFGLAGDDSLSGMGGNDWLFGGKGADLLQGGLGDDRLNGGEGSDTVSYSTADGSITASLATEAAMGEGTDTLIEIENLIGSAFNDELSGDQDANILNGGAGADILSGLNGSDLLVGGAGRDLLNGDKGDDRLDGGLARDIMIGGNGSDILTGGGGSDVFRYLDISDSKQTGRDLITDLQAKDIIDLAALDADANTAGDQAFLQVATFTGAAGQLRLTYDAGAQQTTLAVDVNGDGLADFALLIAGEHLSAAGWVL